RSSPRSRNFGTLIPPRILGATGEQRVISSRSTPMATRPNVRIAHLSGPNATIQNTPPLVTSNKARQKHDLPLLKNPDGSMARFDALRAQRLAAPVKIYVEQFSAHPLERDAAELYYAPDGYVD